MADLRAPFAAGLCRGLARVPPACRSALSPAGLAERALCAQEVLDGGLPWGEGGMGCRNQDFRLSTPGLHFLCQSFPVNHFQTIRRGEEGCCSQQEGLQRYLLSFFCSNNSFLFLLLPLFPFLAQVSFCTFSLLPLCGSSALPLTPTPFLESLRTSPLSKHLLCSALLFSTPLPSPLFLWLHLSFFCSLCLHPRFSVSLSPPPLSLSPAPQPPPPLEGQFDIIKVS